MKPEWKSFLIDGGAEFDGDLVVHFGNDDRERRAALAGPVLADLSHYGLIGVHGDDAVPFLQNQFTNDVTQVDPGHAQLSGWCNPKGRLLTTFLHFIHGESHFLRLPRELVEPTLERLGKFVFRSKVTIEDADDALVRFGYSGPHADEELGKVLGGAPQESWEAGLHDGIIAIRIPGIHPRFELHGELAPMRSLWERLNVHAAPVGAGVWRLLNILARLPEIHAATAESFVPQMVDLHLVDGLSFTKGCYPGQEVVARSEYLGKLKRHMYALDAATIEPPPPGTPVVTKAGEEAGTIVDAAPHPDGHVAALAVLSATHAGDDLRIGTTDGAVVSQPQPAHELPDK